MKGDKIILGLISGSFLVVGAVILSLMAFTPNEKPVVYLVGDSTMSDKRISSYPETGWGMPFPYYLNDEIEVENHARNGRSTRTFIEEGRWDTIKETLKAGDFVLVQFGHNDEVPTKTRYTPPEQFQQFLRQYIAETREHGAHPILLTPITRRQFDENGQVKETHEQYSALMREVAESENVPMIDMDRKSQAMLTEIGEEKSTLLFLQLEPGQNPNYPEGVTDNTHFSETGARMMAELVLEGLKELDHELATYIVEPEEE
ncbi:rhamnogalacturonan acetylesterase [Gracilimonas mengyeensis]|uniref:Lysophospholipase L1 n=1 Tax=Gracilimonas mengyeensis TaxID=1302730 RepID=A0A521FDH3_9BACT|nr:rhamnogalacturonan acetylesterase [Gracilimonas mengyeensis]SMO94226.1 Lysophospholipase L1 [Gracilimonas mengyeensis]